MYYTVILAFMGIIWVLITMVFKDRIKKYWLYSLFPTIIYSIPIISYGVERDMYVLLALTIVYTYLLIKLIRGFSFIDTLIIPSTLIVILAILVEFRGGG